MNRKQLAALTLALVGLGTAGLAQARGDVDVQWSVTIGSPGGVYAPAPVVVAAQPVYVQRPVVRAYPAPYPVYAPAPVYRQPYGQPYRHAGWGDADRDGIPNRYDRVYNPRWDRDGDGVPNRYDRHPGRGGR